MRGSRRFILLSLALTVLLGVMSVIAQNNNSWPVQTVETYTRPKPTKPLKPSIPDANRFQDDKVFLEYADSLYRPKGEMEELQIVKGSVKFRHGGMWMFCDSAYYYPEKNSMDAYGHVEMRQGDTLFVYADKLYYDGEARHAILTKGPSRDNVQLKDRKVTLTTDSLDYDLNSELGWYSTGGRLEDDLNTLTSRYGDYSTSEKVAKFRDDVVLVNRKDGYRLVTQELDYNTVDHLATINRATRIEGANDTIITTKGWYDTANDRATLTARSTILHCDSTGNVTTLEGDSIVYDKPTRTNRAYMFSDPAKLGKPMVITDTARKVTLIGGYGEYNDSTGRAYSSNYPLLMEYSRPDTLFLRADTVVSYIERVVPSSFRASVDPLSRTDVGDVAAADSVAPDTLVAGVLAEVSDSMRLTAVRPVPQTTDSVMKEYRVAKAIGRARFFNQDLQGVADTILVVERDSMLHMLRRPIVWTGERQVYGPRIDVHFNDSTPDWAELPQGGLVGEHIAEDFFNQMSGSHIKAFLENQRLKRLEVDGNVMTIFLPQESDSSYNKLVYAESSYLTLDMDSTSVDHLKMWPEVNGTVTPLFEVKKTQQTLQGFRWMDYLRPKREWYGSRWKWLDDLGEVPEALDAYFKSEEDLVKPPVPVTPPPSAPAASYKGPAGFRTKD